MIESQYHDVMLVVRANACQSVGGNQGYKSGNRNVKGQKKVLTKFTNTSTHSWMQFQPRVSYQRKYCHRSTHLFDSRSPSPNSNRTTRPA